MSGSPVNHLDTIGNLLTDGAEHTTQMKKTLIREPGLTPVEYDEFRMLVKNIKRSSESDLKADSWVYTNIQRETYFLIAFFSWETHQREGCDHMMNHLYAGVTSPCPDSKPEIFSDGNINTKRC